MENVTQKQVAEYAGVAQSTVGLILANHPRATRYSIETRQRVREAAEKLRYHPNEIGRQLQGKKSSLIGVLIGAGDAYVNYDRLFKIERALAKRGYRVLVGQVDDDIERTQAYIKDFASRGIGSVICLQHEMPLADFEAVPRCLSLIPNAVYLDKPAGLANAHYVQVEYGEGIRLAVEHLAARGCRRIALGMLGGALEGSCTLQRYNGYCQGLKAAGLPINPALMWLGDESPRITDFSIIPQWIDRFVVAHHADAIIASNDVFAVELSYALQDRGYRVPEDVRIVGYDNIDLSRACRPQLTTIDQQNDQLVPLLVERVLAGSSGKAGAESGGPVSVKPRLIVRQST